MSEGHEPHQGHEPEEAREAHEERELIFASFEDAAMGAVAEKALREWDHQVDSDPRSATSPWCRGTPSGEVHVHQAGHISPQQGRPVRPDRRRTGRRGAGRAAADAWRSARRPAFRRRRWRPGRWPAPPPAQRRPRSRIGRRLATGVASAMTGAVGAAVGRRAGGIASLFGFKDEELQRRRRAWRRTDPAVIRWSRPTR